MTTDEPFGPGELFYRYIPTDEDRATITPEPPDQVAIVYRDDIVFLYVLRKGEWQINNRTFGLVILHLLLELAARGRHIDLLLEALEKKR